MQRMSRVGNTCYIFDNDGSGRVFNSMGRCTGETRFESIVLTLKTVVDVDVISVLGIPGSNCCDVYFGGMAGVSNHDCKEIVMKIKKLPNLLTVPLRLSPEESQGVLQVLFVARKNCFSVSDISRVADVKQWRNAR